jgi:phage repressor protein C with HTH and peptisase S24 domain
MVSYAYTRPVTADTLGTRIAQARKAKGLSQEELASQVGGLSRAAVSQWEHDETRPRDLPLVAQVLGCSYEWLGTGKGEMASGESPAEFEHDLRRAVPMPANFQDQGQRDLPVLGNAMGGPEGYFEMQGNVIEHVWRPPYLNTVRNAFALYVIGSSMEPRYFEGELIYCRPDRRPRAGEFVVLETHPKGEGGPIAATIGQFRRQTANHIELEKLNPRTVLKVETARIHRIHLIVGTGQP